MKSGKQKVMIELLSTCIVNEEKLDMERYHCKINTIICAFVGKISNDKIYGRRGHILSVMYFISGIV
ncbi:hypothetical protein PIROE2DRAFT_17366 [Piromyces sp. E2]|nr:hypothetical protein PIROE2DRAFT_17366 [Piromyces sp. E2]|eukprot:OUM57596.1 hypothetical protein PIROE2DRAFT_17366 [Piromyces sp. E2]